MSKVLAFDTDSKTITYARIFNELAYSGILKPDGKASENRRAEDRFPRLVHALEELLVEFPNTIWGWAYVEKPMFTVNPASTVAQSRMLGAIESALVRANIPFSEVDPGTWKKTLLGNGHASKEQIKAWVIANFEVLDDLTQDQYDAYAIAAYGRLVTSGAISG